jgi:ABC-type transport system substrate-binding protein
VGCGGGRRRTPQPTHGDPAPQIPGGNVRIGRPIYVLGLDPHIDLTGLDIDQLLYSYLYSWDPVDEQTVFNNLAVTVEIPDPQQTEFIFKLRRGVMAYRQWENSEQPHEVVSEDVVESFVRRGTRITAPDKRFPLRISGADTNDSAHARGLRDGFQAPDPYTFSIRMKQPFVPALGEMANPTWAIAPAEIANPPGSDSWGGGPFARESWGSGPFMLTTFEGTERLILRRHPRYFLEPRPWLNEILYSIIEDHQALRDAFDSNAVDAIPMLTRAEAEQRKDDEEVVIAKSAVSGSYPVIHFKNQPGLPLADTRVWEAFDLALNRDEMIERIWEGDGHYNGPVPRHCARYTLPEDEVRASMPYDPRRARRLMAEAGLEDGLELKMRYPRLHGIPSVANLASLVRDQVAQIGINLTLEEVEYGSFIANTLLPGNFDIALFPQLPYDEPDRPLAFYHSRGVTGTTSWNYYRNEEIDQLIEAQQVEFDAGKRRDIILQAQRRILKEHGPQLTLPSGDLYSAHWKWVHNLPGYPEPGDAGETKTSAIVAGPPGADAWTEAAN